MKNWDIAKRIRLILVLMMLAAIAVRSIPVGFPWILLPGSLYAVIAVIWTASLGYRIGPDHTRRLMTAVGILLAVLFVAQNYRYSLAIGDSFTHRLSWFVYYVTFTFVPLLSFLSVLSIERGYVPSGLDLPLIVICSVLNVLILTNDLHQWFQIYTGVGEGGEILMAPGPLYYAAMAWEVFFALATLVMIYRKLRIRELRRKIWIPALAAGLGTAATIVFALFFEEYRVFGLRPFRVNDLFLITVILSWELAFSTGLVPSNGDYEGLFSSMKLDAIICGAGDSPALRSAGSVISDEQIERAARGPYTEGGLRISSRHIRGGRIVWADDVSGLERLGRELSDITAQLEDSVALLKKEQELADERAALSARRRIYEDIYIEMEKALRQIEGGAAECGSLEGESLKAGLCRLLMLGAYVKRGINLRLMAAGGTAPGPSDLRLSIDESLKYLELSGMKTDALRKEAARLVSSCEEGGAVKSYDMFEDEAERAFAGAFGREAAE